MRTIRLQSHLRLRSRSLETKELENLHLQFQTLPQSSESFESRHLTGHVDCSGEIVTTHSDVQE